MAVQQLVLRQKSIAMFSYHMLVQSSERRPPLESHTKYRPPISMDLKATVGTKVLISTTQRECSRGPLRAASVLFRLPSVFEFSPKRI